MGLGRFATVVELRIPWIYPWGVSRRSCLTYEDEKLSAYRDKSPQELRHVLSQQIHKEVFFATLVSKAQSSINSSALLKALQALAWSDEQAA